MDYTTPSKVDKANTSSAKAPMAQALVARSRSKASDDALVDDNPDLLNFVMAVSWICCWTSFRPQKYWPNSEKLDGSVFMIPDVTLIISIFSHEDVKGVFWMRSWLASLVLLPSANL
jgi:hypothetical protein